MSRLAAIGVAVASVSTPGVMGAQVGGTIPSLEFERSELEASLAFERGELEASLAFERSELEASLAFERSELEASLAFAQDEPEIARAWSTFERGRTQAWSTFERERTRAWSTFERGRAQAWSTFERGRAQTRQTASSRTELNGPQPSRFPETVERDFPSPKSEPDGSATPHDAPSGTTSALEATPSILPVTGLVSSPFSHSRDHPIHNLDLPHEGIDIAAPAGTAIVATAPGRIAFAGTKPGYGKMIEIDHGFGFRTRYAHASRLLKSVGQIVARSETIAEVGCSGACTGPHVHYEVLVSGRPVDPVGYLPRP